jgi:beta-glucosidase
VKLEGVTRATPYGISFWDFRVGGAVNTPVEKAAGHPATASSIEAALPSATADKAVDGSSTTRWSSSVGDNRWWQVDLGRSRQVDKVTINWENAYASRYRIMTSTDGASYTQAADVSIPSAGIHTTTFASRNARYVRIEGVTRATPYGISIWEVQVFGVND